ncbi:MAG: ion transporter [Vulcanimicrobiota bacterium]
MLPRLERFCRRLTSHAAFDVVVLALIVASVVLLSYEIAVPQESALHLRLVRISEVITAFFVIELIIRFIAMKRRDRFLREYWIDILAVLPLLRVFRVFRFLRLLRLLRLFRLASLLTSNSRIFKFLLQRRAAEYLFTLFLLGFATVFGTLGMSHFRESDKQGWERLAESFWETLFSLVAGEYISTFPSTLGGKMVILFVQFCGLAFFALLTGTVSAVMIEKLREGTVLKRMMLEDLEDHILICGWNSGVETILVELQSSSTLKNRDIVVVAGRDELPVMNLPNPSNVRLLTDDFTRAEVLLRANVLKAAIAIIVSDVSSGRSRQDADARTVLAALTIEKLNPAVHTCAELSNAVNETHLRMGGVNEVIITRDLAGHLLAQAALYSANVHLLQELLRPTKGNSLMPFKMPEELVGQTFDSVLTSFYQKTGAIPVAIERADGKVLVNPKTYRLCGDDALLCVAAAEEQGNKPSTS